MLTVSLPTFAHVLLVELFDEGVDLLRWRPLVAEQSLGIGQPLEQSVRLLVKQLRLQRHPVSLETLHKSYIIIYNQYSIRL